MPEKTSMKITYVLPPNSNTPVGGYKVVYQYANELVKKGHQVNIVFLKNVIPNLKWYSNQSIRNKINRLFGRTVKNVKNVSWFPIDHRVKLYFDVEKEKDFPIADVIIATAAPTTYINSLGSQVGRKFYFIQNYEEWWYKEGESRLLDTFRLPNMTNIVISRELENKVRAATDKKIEYLPNFYDPNEFFLENDIELRNNVVALLNHSQETKRTKLGIEILKEVKKQIPDLSVELFGVPEMPKDLPEYFHGTQMASPNQLRKNIFGKSKIYLLPSVLEGWVLTGMEAMASGSAVVASKIGGIVDYANDTNSVLVEPDNKDQFVKEIVGLLSDDKKRQQIARKGYQDVQQYRIEKSTLLLESILQGK